MSEDSSFEFRLPPEHEAGVYANTFGVWHTAYDFTIDFAASQLPKRADPADPYVVSCRVVSRVRLPAGAVFDLLRTINAAMSLYEAQWGEIQPPRPRGQDEHEQA